MTFDPFQSLTVDLPPTGRLLMLSDGIVEQRARRATRREQNQFWSGKACRCHPHQRASGDGDVVKGLFDAVVRLRGAGRNRRIDATAVLVKWCCDVKT